MLSIAIQYERIIEYPLLLKYWIGHVRSFSPTLEKNK